MTDVSLVFRELNWAFTDALSSFMKVPKDGRPKDVKFMTDPPDRGFFKWSASVDGRKVLICELCYCYPPFENIRGWMERSLVFDHFGHLNTHILTLESRDYTVTVSLHHLGWDDDGRNPSDRCYPLSYLVIVRSDQAEPVLCCLCKTNGTIKRMYESLMEGLTRYSLRFDDPRHWPECRSFKIWFGKGFADLYRDQLRSKDVERLSE